MKTNDRKEFADSRPLPAFGAVLKWLVEILQFRDPITFGIDAQEMDAHQQLRKFLDSRTADDVFAGLIVKDDTKGKACQALAACLRALPKTPFALIPLEQLTESLCNFWATYERTSGLLSSIPAAREQIRRALIRHVTVELAVRAGALAYLYDDADQSEDFPLWSQDLKLKELLRKQLQQVGTRDVIAEKLNKGESEVDRWLDDLDIPAVADINRLNKELDQVGASRRGQCPLWRLYVGRRIWNSVKENIPPELQDDVLRAYSRIRRRIYTFFALESRDTEEEKRNHAVSLALTGRIISTPLAFQAIAGESDTIWLRQIKAAFKIEGVSTTDIVRFCQTWAGLRDIFEHERLKEIPAKFEDFVRLYYAKAELGVKPSDQYALILEESRRRESGGDFDGAAICAAQLVLLAPYAAGAWYTLGRMRRFQKNREDTELCFRKALELDPNCFDARTDLVVLLAMAGRVKEAEGELEKSDVEQRQRVEWRFAHGLVLLSSQQSKEAMVELLECARIGFVPGVCYQFAAFAADILQIPNEAREYRKRAEELQATVDQPVLNGVH